MNAMLKFKHCVSYWDQMADWAFKNVVLLLKDWLKNLEIQYFVRSSPLYSKLLGSSFTVRINDQTRLSFKQLFEKFELTVTCFKND